MYCELTYCEFLKCELLNKYMVPTYPDSWGRYLTASTLGMFMSKGSYKHYTVGHRTGKSSYLFGHFSTIYGTILAPEAIETTVSGTPGASIKGECKFRRSKTESNIGTYRMRVFVHSNTGSGTSTFYMMIVANYHYVFIVTVPTAVPIYIED